MTMLEYKGYIGSVAFDNEAGLFHGDVVNTRDVITFQGESVPELRQAFQDSVEDYLEFCTELGRQPEKPMSGKFNVRISPQLHAYAAASAASQGLSLNALVERAIEQMVNRAAPNEPRESTPESSDCLEITVPDIETHLSRGQYVIPFPVITVIANADMSAIREG